MLSDGYTTSDVDMKWREGEDSIRGINEIEIPQFTIKGHDTQTANETTATGAFTRHFSHVFWDTHTGLGFSACGCYCMELQCAEIVKMRFLRGSHRSSIVFSYYLLNHGKHTES